MASGEIVRRTQEHNRAGDVFQIDVITQGGAVSRVRIAAIANTAARGSGRFGPLNVTLASAANANSHVGDTVDSSVKETLTPGLPERAKCRNFAVAEVQISETETPQHRLETIYRRLIERLNQTFRLEPSGWPRSLMMTVASTTRGHRKSA